MKQIIYAIVLLLTLQAKAQDTLPEVHLPTDGDLHFISPEPIQYVDISNKSIEGDIALPNLLRLRYKDSALYSGAIVTIVGEKFIAQYRLVPVTSTEHQLVEIAPEDTRPLDISGIGLSKDSSNIWLIRYFAPALKKYDKSNRLESRPG
jgi:ABC-type amino acid transport substrate-binding protein